MQSDFPFSRFYVEKWKILECPVFSIHVKPTFIFCNAMSRDASQHNKTFAMKRESSDAVPFFDRVVPCSNLFSEVVGEKEVVPSGPPTQRKELALSLPFLFLLFHHSNIFCSLFLESSFVPPTCRFPPRLTSSPSHRVAPTSPHPLRYPLSIHSPSYSNIPTQFPCLDHSKK